MNLDSPVSTIMTTGVECVNPQQKLIDLKHIYESPNFHSHVPVVENEELIGIVSLINFMRAIHDASLDDTEEVYHELKVEDIMTLKPTSVSPETTIREASTILANGYFHSLPIVKDGSVVGIITTTDLLKEIIK